MLQFAHAYLQTCINTCLSQGLASIFLHHRPHIVFLFCFLTPQTTHCFFFNVFLHHRPHIVFFNVFLNVGCFFPESPSLNSLASAAAIPAPAVNVAPTSSNSNVPGANAFAAVASSSSLSGSGTQGAVFGQPLEVVLRSEYLARFLLKLLGHLETQGKHSFMHAYSCKHTIACGVHVYFFSISISF